jgi:hypothetical protein
MTSIAAQPTKIETETTRKVTFRIIPFLMVCYFIAFVDRVSLWQVISNKYVLAASLIYAGASSSSQVLSLWPQIIKSFGLSNMQTGLVNSIPFGIASVLMVPRGRNSDRTSARTCIPRSRCCSWRSVFQLRHSLARCFLLSCCCVSPSRPLTSSRGHSGPLRRNGCWLAPLPLPLRR